MSGSLLPNKELSNKAMIEQWNKCNRQVSIMDEFNEAYKKIITESNSASLTQLSTEMYEMLNKCQSCIKHLLDPYADDMTFGEAENTLSEVEALLSKIEYNK